VGLLAFLVQLLGGKRSRPGNTDAWVDETKPAKVKPFKDHMTLARWDYNTNRITFAFRTKLGPAGASQVALVAGNKGTSPTLSGHDGNKLNPWLWKEPELSGELLLVCNVDNRALGICRGQKHDDKSRWKRIATLTLPKDARYKLISSVEVIAPATGIGGVSYLVLLARESKDRNSPGIIWVLGLGKDEKRRFARRVDDCAVTGEEAICLSRSRLLARTKSMYTTTTSVVAAVNTVYGAPPQVSLGKLQRKSHEKDYHSHQPLRHRSLHDSLGTVSATKRRWQ